jgi:hypothetical protein
MYIRQPVGIEVILQNVPSYIASFSELRQITSLNLIKYLSFALETQNIFLELRTVSESFN